MQIKKTKIVYHYENTHYKKVKLTEKSAIETYMS